MLENKQLKTVLIFLSFVILFTLTFFFSQRPVARLPQYGMEYNTIPTQLETHPHVEEPSEEKLPEDETIQQRLERIRLRQ